MSVVREKSASLEGIAQMKRKMKRNNVIHFRLLGTIVTSLLITSIFTVTSTFSVQPLVDSTTYYIGTIGQPLRLDPMRAYDTASGELLQNIYQTLIWWNDTHPITFTPGVGYNLTAAECADLNQYKPVLCTEVPTIANGRLIINSSGSHWRFTINANATFQPWTAANGSLMPPRAITAEDVVYSFRRQVIYDSSYSPSWLWMSPALGYPNWATSNGGPYSCYSNGTFRNVADEAAAAILMQNWVYNVGDDVCFNFQFPWTEGILKQIFAQTWGAVVNPDWVVEHGGWDGSFAAGWSNYYRWKPTRTSSELDTYKDPAVYGAAHASKYASFTYSACGTGPYMFTSWDIMQKIWRIDANPAYWFGFDNAGDGAGNYISTVVSRGVDPWPTKKMLFLEGEFDVADVSRANIYDLLTSKYNPIPGINLVCNIPLLSNNAMIFNMNISHYIGAAYVGYPTHISLDPYFFNNTHIRRAFAWALNYTAYVQDAWDGEAIVQRSWWVDGLSPQEYKNENSSMLQRNLNYTEMQNELNQAIINGVNVSEAGFDVTCYYLEAFYDDRRLMPFNLTAQAFATLNPAKYKVRPVGLPLIFSWSDDDMAMSNVGWLADFADPDNFCRAYMRSSGSVLVAQGPPYPDDQSIIDWEIDAAVVEQDSNVRMALYQDLQYRYWLDVPSFPLVQPLGRRWARDWVYGWYYNALYPGMYAYDLWKSVSAAPQPVDIDVVHTLTPITAWHRIYWYQNGCAIIGYEEGDGPPNGSLATYTYSLEVKRTESNTAVPSLLVTVGLKRLDLNNSYSINNTFYSSIQLVLLGPGETKTVLLNMTEDGTFKDFFPGNHTFQLSAVSNVYQPDNAYDNDTTNNAIVWGTFRSEGPLIGDLKIDGVVNILDCIALSLKFGLNPGDLGWDMLVDLKPDGVINILDSIVVALNFAKTAPGPQFL